MSRSNRWQIARQRGHVLPRRIEIGSQPWQAAPAQSPAPSPCRNGALRSVHGEPLEVGGPENLSMRQVAETIMCETKISGTVSAVPLPMMRLLAVLMRPVNATLARQIGAGVTMDTKDMSFDPSEMRHRYPSMSYTSLADVVRRDSGTGV
jgi:hypothetical protein